MQTSVPQIYAVGDVTLKKPLAHVAENMGIIAAENIAGAQTVTLDYRFMPQATYCQPQIASFGYTEAGAREAGYELNIARFPWQANGKALGMGESAGFVKLISDKNYGELLGAHMIGHGVTELLPGVDAGAVRRADGNGDRAQRSRASHARRGAQGSRARPRRPHD